MKIKLKFMAIMFFTVMISFTACGGGGGGGDSLVNGYNVNLSELNLSSGTIPFNPENTVYNIEVENAVSSISIKPVAVDNQVRIEINGTVITSGNYSDLISLTVGANTFVITVTAPDGITIKTYKVVVVRLALSALSSNANLSRLSISDGVLSPVFNENTLDYNVSVQYNIDSFKVTPVVAGVNASIKVNTISVDSGRTSEDIILNPGSTDINIVVTAEDLTTKTYKIVVTRLSEPSHNADLANLTLSYGSLSPEFGEDTLSYTSQVSYNITSITVTPTVADSKSTVMVNNIEVSSETASTPISLSLGENTITVDVKAEDLTTKTYKIIVTKNQMQVIVSASDGLYSDRVSISWLPIDGVDEYKLYRSTSEAGSYVLLATISGTSYDDPVSDYKKYYYKAKYILNGLDSSIGDSDSGYRQPAFPGNVTASDGTDNDQISIGWNAISGVNLYYIYRSESAAGTFIEVGTSAANSFIDTSVLNMNKVYFYKVKSYANCFSEESNIDSGYKGKTWIRLGSLNEPLISDISVFNGDVFVVQHDTFNLNSFDTNGLDSLSLKIHKYSSSSWSQVISNDGSYTAGDSNITSLRFTVSDGVPYVAYSSYVRTVQPDPDFPIYGYEMHAKIKKFINNSWNLVKDYSYYLQSQPEDTGFLNYKISGLTISGSSVYYHLNSLAFYYYRWGSSYKRTDKFYTNICCSNGSSFTVFDTGIYASDYLNFNRTVKTSGYDNKPYSLYYYNGILSIQKENQFICQDTLDISHYEFTIDQTNGDVYLVYRLTSGSTVVRKYSNAVWEQIGEFTSLDKIYKIIFNNSSLYIAANDVSFNSGGYNFSTSTGANVILKYNGSDWKQTRSALTPEESQTINSIAIDNGVIYIATASGVYKSE